MELKMLLGRVGFCAFLSTMACAPATPEGEQCDISTIESQRTLAAEEHVSCSLEIRRTDLTSLEHLAGLVSADAVTLEDNASLSDVSALAKMDLSDTPFVIEANPRVRELELESAAVALLLVSCMPDLERINMPVLTVADSMLIEQSPVSVLVAPVAELYTLRIEGTELTSLDGLSALTRVSSLEITHNSRLTEAAISAFVARLAPPPASTIICGNATDTPCGVEYQAHNCAD